MKRVRKMLSLMVILGLVAGLFCMAPVVQAEAIESYSFESEADITALAVTNTAAGVAGADVIKLSGEDDFSGHLWATEKSSSRVMELRAWPWKDAATASSEDLEVRFSFRKEDNNSEFFLNMRGFDSGDAAKDCRILRFGSDQTVTMGGNSAGAGHVIEDIGYTFELGTWYDVRFTSNLKQGFFRVQIKEGTASGWEFSYVISRAANQITGLSKLNGFHLGVDVFGEAQTDIYVDDFVISYATDAYPQMIDNYTFNYDFDDLTEGSSLPTPDFSVQNAVDGATEIVPYTVAGREGVSVLMRTDLTKAGTATAKNNYLLHQQAFRPYNANREIVDARLHLKMKLGSLQDGATAGERGLALRFVPERDGKGAVKETRKLIKFAGGNVQIMESTVFAYEPGKLYDFDIIYKYSPNESEREFTIAVTDGEGNQHVRNYTDWSVGYEGTWSADWGYLFDGVFSVSTSTAQPVNSLLIDDYSWNTCEKFYAVSTSPADGASDAAPGAPAVITYSAPLSAAALEEAAITVTSGGEAVAFTTQVFGEQLRIAITDAKENTTYDIAVSGVKSLYGETSSEDVQFSFTTGKSISISAPTFSTDTLNASEITISAVVQSAAGDQDVVLVGALYDSNNRLVEMFASEDTAAVESKTISVTCDLTGKDITGHRLDAFVWSGFDTMKPLSAANGIE